VVLPITSLKTNFKFSADLLKSDETKIGDILFSGWIDFVLKNMEAKLNLRDLDITYFAPYYGNFLSRKNLLSAKLNTQTTFKSRDNNLDTLTEFKLSNMVYAAEEGESAEITSLNLTKNALDFFTDPAGNLILEFKVNTKLDNPSLSIDDLKKIILQAAVKNIARQNPEEIIKKISGNIEQFKDFGKEMKRIFKDK
jgi:hypothetical protein